MGGGKKRKKKTADQRVRKCMTEGRQHQEISESVRIQRPALTSIENESISFQSQFLNSD
jgi:hypothetical protein